jgi:hypothetical protein
MSANSKLLKSEFSNNSGKTFELVLKTKKWTYKDLTANQIIYDRTQNLKQYTVNNGKDWSVLKDTKYKSLVTNKEIAINLIQNLPNYKIYNINGKVIDIYKNEFNQGFYFIESTNEKKTTYINLLLMR